jgi:hypothetical protein
VPLPYADRVKETSTTTGTGNFTLSGAVTQFSTFTSRFATDTQFAYAIVGQTGSEWEVGVGHLSGASTLVRDRVTQSSNADAAVNFSAGTKDVFVTLPSERVNMLITIGQALAAAMGAALP